jgi:site-specific recombinase
LAAVFKSDLSDLEFKGFVPLVSICKPSGFFSNILYHMLLVKKKKKKRKYDYIAQLPSGSRYVMNNVSTCIYIWMQQDHNPEDWIHPLCSTVLFTNIGN